MCGIAGTLEYDSQRPGRLELVRQMAAALSHRGPDYQGAHVDGPVALSHARLSIIDLSAEANQPMLSDDGSVALVFNGEIYNFRELARELAAEGVRFRSRSDTEVLLRLYEARGLDFLSSLRGMFALGLWDRRERRLLLARDRVGQKPLFYRPSGSGLTFASELGALLCDQEFEREVDLEAMHLHLGLGYVPSSHCILRGVRKVPPGCYVSWRDGRLEQRRYWTLRFDQKRGASVADLTAALRYELDRAVRLRMISDVPLGAFLSGGIDSSLIVALMARASCQPIKTFSIGFEEKDFSEVEFARLIAERYHTEHHEEIVRPDAVALLPELVRCYGEPFADPSALPTYLLSQMTRRHVTVALSGDGGDESFAGYTRYAQQAVWRLYQRLPRRLARRFARLVEQKLPGRSAGKWGELAAGLRYHARRMAEDNATSYQLQFGNFSTTLLRQLYTPALRQAGQLDAEALFSELLTAGSATNEIDALLELDTQTYLPDDIFVKVDIASMAHSLEARSPLVDHHVLELAAALEPGLKLRGIRGKQILRWAVADLLPRSIVRRRKRGFGIPHARWLRGDLRALARDTLLSARAHGRGYFERRPLEALLDEHDSGRIDHGLRIWNLLWLELWHRHFIDRQVIDRQVIDRQVIDRQVIDRQVIDRRQAEAGSLR